MRAVVIPKLSDKIVSMLTIFQGTKGAAQPSFATDAERGKAVARSALHLRRDWLSLATPERDVTTGSRAAVSLGQILRANGFVG